MVVDLRRIRKYIFMILIIFIGVVSLIVITNNKSDNIFVCGNIYISKVNNIYKISNIDINDENYLCTPYHGWSNYGELSVEIKYGNWCKMIKTMGKSEVAGYEKKVYYSLIKRETVFAIYYKYSFSFI